MERLLAALVVALALGLPAASAVFIEHQVVFDDGKYGSVGQTTLFRADVTGVIGGGTLYSMVIQDKNSQGGSSGVFSGFDLDFVVFDRDGDFSTTTDRVLPKETDLTYVEKGVMRKGAASAYQPTVKHPGPLFGLKVDPDPKTAECPIDFATATLGVRDASYRAGTSLLSVDTSTGWVSLGDGGSIRIAFPLISLSAGESLYMFLGEVGERDEFASGSAKILTLVVEPNPPSPTGPTRIWLDPQGRREVKLDGGAQSPSTGATWLWDLNGDGAYDDGTGRYLDVTYEYLTATLGLSEGDHAIKVLTKSGSSSEPYVITLVPEPATWLLLGVAAPLLWRRKRNCRS